MPPHCAVCGLSFRTAEPGGFGLSMRDYELIQVGPPVDTGPHWVGHPPGAVWYCRRHTAAGHEAKRRREQGLPPSDPRPEPDDPEMPDFLR